ncbi:hypothetical protein GOP47_0026774, partial [Adiantum capillus-veneris]
MPKEMAKRRAAIWAARGGVAGTDGSVGVFKRPLGAAGGAALYRRRPLFSSSSLFLCLWQARGSNPLALLSFLPPRLLKRLRPNNALPLFLLTEASASSLACHLAGFASSGQFGCDAPLSPTPLFGVSRGLPARTCAAQISCALHKAPTVVVVSQWLLLFLRLCVVGFELVCQAGLHPLLFTAKLGKLPWHAWLAFLFNGSCSDSYPPLPSFNSLCAPIPSDDGRCDGGH